MEMINANDFWYLPRVENLKREYTKCEKRLRVLQYEFEDGLHFETVPCYRLTVLADKINIVEELMESLEDQIDNLTLATLN